MSTRDEHATWFSSPNFWPGRMGYKPRYVILHGTAGGAGGSSVNWLCNTASQASVHYVITQEGKIYQLVDEEASAWGNGLVEEGHDTWWSSDTNPNLITISIEHEKPDDQNQTALTAAQALASFQLVSRICQRWNIPARPADASGGITGHFSMQPDTRAHCPGVYPWQGLYQYLAQTNGDDLKMLTLDDPIGRFFTQIDKDHWRCNQTGCTIAFSHLAFFRKFEGVFGLPITNEIYLAALPGTAIQCYERGIAIYDPKFTAEGQNPTTKAGTSGVYLMRIDRGIGQQIIAKSLLAELQKQIADLTAKANQPAVNQAELDNLKKLVAHYQQALQQIKTLANI